MTLKIKNDVNWNDRYLLLRSACVGLGSCGIFLFIGESAKPSEGYAFDRLPTVAGVYQCCSTGSGKSSESWVGSVYAKCNTFDYFPFVGTRWHDCGQKDVLNGRVVEIERVVTPTLLSSDAYPVVIKLSSDGKTYIEYSNEQIRDRWIRSMHSGAYLLALFVALTFHFFQLLYFNGKFKKQIGKMR